MFGIDDLRWSDEVRLGWVVHVISHIVVHNDSKCFFYYLSSIAATWVWASV